MGANNPILTDDEFDVREKDYSIETEEDINNVVSELDREFDVVSKYARRDGEEDGWKHDAVLAAMLTPWLEYEWENVDTALKRLPVGYASGDYEYQKRVEKTAEYITPEREWETPSDAADTARDAVSLVEEEDISSVDPQGKIREEVLKEWHPREFGIYPEDDGVEIDPIDKREALQRTANIFDEVWDYLYPETDVRGWQNTLYVYDNEKGIYRPRGSNQIRLQAESLLGKYADNNFVNELESKLKRRNKVDSWDMRDARPEPHRIVVGNGVLDLRKGELDGYTADEYHRTRIDVDYDPDAECAEIDDFFHDIVDEDDVPTLYRAVAHTLAKEYIDEKAVMLVGDGNNGKSSFLNLLEEFLGERNISGRSLQELNEDKWAPADLHGSLANLSGDMSEQEADDLSTFKQLTGGDTLTADIKFEQPVRFENSASLIFASNGVPDFPDNDMAVWQRWCYINFPHRFGEDGNKEAEPMRVLMDRITADEELRGLLARCVEEYQAYYDGRDFFADVGDAHEVRKRMKKAAEPVFRFAEEMLENVDVEEVEDIEDYAVLTDRVREAYKEYAREEGLPIIDDAQFGSKLTNLRDYDIEHVEQRPIGPDKRNYVYKGIQLTDEAEELLDEDGDGDGDDDDGGNAELGDDFNDDDDDEDGTSHTLTENKRRSVRAMATETDESPEEIRETLQLPDEASDRVAELVTEVRSEGLGETLSQTGGDDQ
ncbi:DNA primase family protein [Natronomonas marina]|uniref:DNA primase family protein n=1 Tax=Natronomonas marina TaxID=2961939 RepID=UPI0020C9A3EC|nr:phage/plasmid primase, P4 family [Natronomonas marina]